MTGYHEVKTFYLEDGEVVLPSGWKPFAAFPSPAGTLVLCRKWHRHEK